MNPPIRADMPWVNHASCAEVDGDLWYPDEEHRTGHKAVAICTGCPVRLDCLEHALALPETYGVWGGMSERHRRELLRARRRSDVA